MTTSFTTKLDYVIPISFFLVVFQFFGSALSFAHFHLPVLLFFSAIIAFLSTLLLAPRIKLGLSIQSTKFILGITFLSTFLFSLRLNWHIPDYICPTGLLGLVNQIQYGAFPVSFLSFPDIVMNYHQGFVFLAGALSFTTTLSAGIAIKITYIFLYFLLNLLAMLYFKSVHSRYYLLLPFLFLTVTSLSPILFVNLGIFYNFVSVFEQSTSNSFPLTFITILLFLFVIGSTVNPRKKIFISSLLILTTITANATLFSVALLTGFFLTFYHHILIKKLSTKMLVMFVVIGGSIYSIAHFIPSAFMLGDSYTMPDYGLRIWEEPFIKYIKHFCRYILLCGPITGVGLYLAYQTLRQRLFDQKTVLSVALIISFCFPIIVIFNNIDLWDNLHKFAILSLYLSLLLTLLYLGSPTAPRWLSRVLLICIILSTPAIYDQLVNRWSLNYQSHINPAEGVADIVTYLQQHKASSLTPFNIDISGQCDEDNYAGVSEFTNTPLKYAYFANFLLSDRVEQIEAVEKQWSNDPDTIASTLDILPSDAYIIISKNPAINIEKFEQALRPQDVRPILEFTNFYLY